MLTNKSYTLRAVILTIILTSCSKKNQNKAELLLGSWRIKSQVDIFNGIRTHLIYDQTNQKRLEFHSNGRVMTNGIVTPTWAFQPIGNTASYYLKNDVINIGDSSVINGTLYYLNPPMKLKINSISKDLLVIQHIHRLSDPAQLTTIDSLIRF